MLKFQTPMSNDEVCRAMTGKHTNKHTKTYKVFIFYFSFSTKKMKINNSINNSPSAIKKRYIRFIFELSKVDEWL